jgi:hypothetical protein
MLPSYPPVIAVKDTPGGIDTATGVAAHWGPLVPQGCGLVPVPNCPNAFNPQAQARPFESNARLW